MPESIMQFKTFPFELKQSSNDGSAFEGIVSPFFNIDHTQDIIDNLAFDMDMPEFLADGFIGGLNHDWDNPIGTPQPGTKTTPVGLFLKANVIDTSHGLDVRKLLKAKIVKKLSIGFQTRGEQLLETEGEIKSYWQSKGYQPTQEDLARAVRGNARLLTRIKLFEGSPVTVPANDLATITAVKSAAMQALLVSGVEREPDTPHDLDTIQDERSLEAFLRDVGLSKNDAKKFISLSKGILLRRDAGSDEPTTEVTKEADETPAETKTEETDTGTKVEEETPKTEEPIIETASRRIIFSSTGRILRCPL